MQVAVIIVNYCTPDLAIDCLRSLEESGDMASVTRVVVVDGGSPDNSVSILTSEIERRNWSGWVTLLPLEVNGGFAYANNRGMEFVAASFGSPGFYWLLNSDTVIRPGALSSLLGFMGDHPGAAIVGSRLEDPDGTPQHSAFRFHSILSELEATMRLGFLSRMLHEWCVAPPIAEFDVRVDWVSGASMLIRAEVIDAIGKLDEAYFMYYEESDFCLRAVRSGWECWYTPVSRVVHLVGRSSGVTTRGAPARRRPPYWFESRRRYFVKNHGLIYAALADLAWAGGYASWCLRRTLQGKPNNDPPQFLRDFLRQSLLGRRMRTNASS
jgi:GT2 family glycosyltransferase